MSVLLGQANALRIPLADNSVHCCITSPPYWGLRDYGTASWEGGDPECDHADDDKLAERQRQKKSMIAVGERIDGSTRTRVHDEQIGREWQHRNICGKCGARRIDQQLGLEPTPELYVEHMVAVFREVWRVLRPDGVLWLVIADSYQSSNSSQVPQTKDIVLKNSKRAHGVDLRPPRVPGLKPKDLVGIPWRVAFALQADGWWLRSDCIWAKPNPMPESVTDRPSKSHEYVFLLTKSANYYYDADSVREEQSNNSHGGQGVNENWKTAKLQSIEASTLGLKAFEYNPAGRNMRTVWQIATAPYSGSHFATYPPALVERCIKAGSSERGVCSKCGAPWERVTERITPSTWAERKKKGASLKWSGGSGRQDATMAEMISFSPPDNVTTGWQPTCACDAGDPAPAVIFDPFVGSGTTLLVARQLGRHGIGIDLSLPYLREQARERLSLTALEQWQAGKKDGASVTDLPLFAREQ